MTWWCKMMTLSKTKVHEPHQGQSHIRPPMTHKITVVDTSKEARGIVWIRENVCFWLFVFCFCFLLLLLSLTVYHFECSLKHDNLSNLGMISSRHVTSLSNPLSEISRNMYMIVLYWIGLRKKSEPQNGNRIHDPP